MRAVGTLHERQSSLYPLVYALRADVARETTQLGAVLSAVQAQQKAQQQQLDEVVQQLKGLQHLSAPLAPPHPTAVQAASHAAVPKLPFGLPTLSLQGSHAQVLAMSEPRGRPAPPAGSEAALQA